MAYFLAYGNWTTPRYLVITTQNDGDTITEWNEILGQRSAVMPRFDGDAKNLYAPVIKTSLEVTLFRQSESEFTDIIDGNDKEIRAYVTEGERLTVDYEVPAGSTLLFKGNLTFGTWTEKYAHIAPIKLIFHDRIGYMAEEKFLPLKRYMNFIEIVGECLLNIVAADKWLVLNWLYSYTENTITYNYAEEFNYDIASWVGKTKLEVMEDLMTSHGMQLFTDFAYKVGTTETDINYNDVGAIRIRMIASQANAINTQSLYQKKQKVLGSTDVYYYDLETVENVLSTAIFSQLLISEVIPSTFTWSAPFRMVSLEYQGARYYLVLKYYTASEMSQAALEAIGCVFPCTVYYSNYNPILPIFLLSNAFHAFRTFIGWDNISSLSLYGMRATVEGGTEDITVTQTNSNVVAWYDTTDYEGTDITVEEGKFNEGRVERVMNTTDIPLLDNNTTYQIDTRAKEIVGTNDYQKGGLIFPDSILAEYLLNAEEVRRSGGLDNTVRIFPFSYILPTYTTNDAIFQAMVDFYAGNRTLPNPKVELIGGQLGILFDYLSSKTKYLYGEALLKRDTAMSLKITISAYCTDTGSSSTLYVMPVTNLFGAWYYYNYSDTSWKVVDPVNFSAAYGLPLTLVEDTNATVTRSVSMLPSAAGTDIPHKIYFVVGILNTTGWDVTYLTGIQMELVSKQAYPEKLVLRTKINESNRQRVEFDANHYNLPELDGAESIYRNGIYSTTFNPLYTVIYNGSSQTLLAHVSDMYAQNYAFNRWILKAKIRIEKFRLHDLFTLDGKSFIFVNGTYDERRGLLDGIFIEVKIPGRQEAWQWLTGVDMEWQDGTRILHQ